MSRNSWIPARRTSFVVLCHRWGDMLSDEVKVAAFKWMATMVAVLLDLLQAFLQAEETYANVDTTENRHAMLTARKVLEKAMKEFAKTSVRNNPYMTNADREIMGILPPDTTHTPHPRPETLPRIEAEPTGHRQHRVKALNPDTGKTGKPAGVHGARFVWQVGGERPASGGDIARGKFSRKPDLLITFEQADIGKPVYHAVCYENAKGEAGPWSTVVEVYVG